MISDEGKGKGYVEEQGEDNRCRQALLLKKSRFVKTAKVGEVKNVCQNGDRRLCKRYGFSSSTCENTLKTSLLVLVRC
jgi:hypothetical protein